MNNIVQITVHFRIVKGVTNSDDFTPTPIKFTVDPYKLEKNNLNLTTEGNFVCIMDDNKNVHMYPSDLVEYIQIHTAE